MFTILFTVVDRMWTAQPTQHFEGIGDEHKKASVRSVGACTSSLIFYPKIYFSGIEHDGITCDGRSGLRSWHQTEIEREAYTPTITVKTNRIYSVVFL